MLSAENLREIEDRRETLEAITDNTEFLITETNMVEEWLFYSCKITDDFLRKFNSIFYKVNTSVAIEVIRNNNLVNNGLRLRSIPTIDTLESKCTILLIRIKHNTN